MESIPFENLLPDERPSPELKNRVAKWLNERALKVHDKGDYLLFQMDFSYIAVFFFCIRVSGNTVHCLSLHSYILGRFAAGFIDDEDLAELNRRALVGRVVKNANLSLFLIYNVVAEGMSQQIFFYNPDLFKQGIDMIDMHIARLLG
jgi:hypothetical protein